MPTTPTVPLAALTLATLTAALVAAGLPASAEVVRTGQTALTAHLLVTIAERVGDVAERQRLSSAVQRWQSGHLASGRYDLADTHVAVVCFALAAALRTERRHCAAALATPTATEVDWRLIAADCEGLGPTPRGTYDRAVLASAARRLANGHAQLAMEELADHCGLWVEAWSSDVRRAMDAAARGSA